MRENCIIPLLLLSSFYVASSAEVFYNTHQFIQLQEDVVIDGLAQDQPQYIASSITECILHNKQQSYYVQASRNGSHWICSFFDYFENVSLKFIPQKGSEVFRLEFSSTINECKDWLRLGHTEDGVYWINLRNRKTTRVFCDMTTDGGGWTVFQKRFDGSVDFNQDWNTYKSGFGSVEGEHWLGLENIHLLSSIAPNMQLRLYAKRFNGGEKFANFENFFVGDEASKYLLRTGAPTTGSFHNGLRNYADGMMFTTKDSDNDAKGNNNCAITYSSGWWFKECFDTNFNGVYSNNPSVTYAKGVHWGRWAGLYESLKETVMTVRSA